MFSKDADLTKFLRQNRADYSKGLKLSSYPFRRHPYHQYLLEQDAHYRNWYQNYSGYGVPEVVQTGTGYGFPEVQNEIPNNDSPGSFHFEPPLPISNIPNPNAHLLTNFPAGYDLPEVENEIPKNDSPGTGKGKGKGKGKSSAAAQKRKAQSKANDEKENEGELKKF